MLLAEFGVDQRATETFTLSSVHLARSRRSVELAFENVRDRVRCPTPL